MCNQEWSAVDSLSASETGVTVERNGVVIRFDASGRLTRFFDGTYVYKRGLDGSMIRTNWSEKRIDGTTVRIRSVRPVPDERGNELLENAYCNTKRALKGVLAEPNNNLDATARRSIRHVLLSSPETMHADHRHFHSIYEPVSVLPPDQYGAVVLQAVTGCPFDCSFCTLYRTTDVTVRSIEAFEAHVEGVKSFFGRGLSSRRGVFVGDANPLAVPEQLSEMLAVAARILPDQVERGVQAFGNVRTVANLSQQSLETLAEKGLERVAVGAESGSNTILELLRKPQKPGEIREGIDRLKSADIDVSVILLAGVGGSELAETHLSRTTELVASLPLDSDDIVYVSPLVGTHTADYADRLEERCLSPLSDDDIALQATTLRSRLETETPARVARYSVSESIYV